MVPDKKPTKPAHMAIKAKTLPQLFQVVVECRDEAEQRQMFERMKAEGRKVRLLVL